MQRYLFFRQASKSTVDSLCEHFGFSAPLAVREFEVIIQAKRRGFEGKGELDATYEEAVHFLINLKNDEVQKSKANRKKD